jgi:hypothetical protein|tara:strand:+ start:143 stop:310 length:168 start_codon:yes stop_codon:yes gene_type:complete
MTYRELLHRLEELEEEQLDFKVMGYMDEEYYCISELQIKDKNGRLDDGHPYLIVD